MATISVGPRQVQISRGPYELRGANRDLFECQKEEVVLSGPAGTGKAQPLDATVWTPHGPKQMGDIAIGDVVCHPSGGSSTVVAIFPQGVKPVFRVTFNTGESVECTDDHLWEVHWMGGSKRNGKKVREMSAVLPLSQIRKEYLIGKRRPRPVLWVPQTKPVEIEHREVPIDPYLLGLLLGDGSIKYGSVGLTTVVNQHAPFSHSREERDGTKIQDRLRELGLMGKGSSDKFVPDLYKINSREVRLAILQGLLDTDGTVCRISGMPSYTTTSKQLAEDVVFLVESLGGACTVTTKQPAKGKLAYTCWIRFNDVDELFRLTRKKERCKKRTKYPVRRFIASIEPIGEKPCKCIRVSNPDGLYLTDRFVVTHNSVSALLKIHFLCSHIPGIRALICRKTRESLTETGLVTFEEKVVPEGHPILRSGGQRRLRQAYHYPNGSQIVVGGLDKPGKVMSAEYDIAFVQECIELAEGDWEAISTRLRNGKLPYQQLLGDTNPDSPTHWLYKRCAEKRCLMLHSRHEDNPAYYDSKGRQWTPAGLRYLARLNALTGPRKARLRDGRWVQAEGVVYEGWDAALHLVDRREWFGGDPPWEWSRYWSVDFGFVHPFVWQAWAEDPDGRLFRYREIYQTKLLVVDAAKRIKELHEEEVKTARAWARKKYLREGEPPTPGPARERALIELDQRVSSSLRPRKIICDHDAGDRATLERELQMPTVAAKKDIRTGIQEVAARLKAAEDGRPRLFLVRDSLDARDPLLKEAGLPMSTEEEIDSYIWDTRGGRKKGEIPVDKDNHGMDLLRYVCMDRRVTRNTASLR